MIACFIRYFVYALLSLAVQASRQLCSGKSNYEKCSSNDACGCLPVVNTVDDSFCGLLTINCTGLFICSPFDTSCYDPGYYCVQHPKCGSIPICYPYSMATGDVCPPLTMINTTTTTTMLPTTTTVFINSLPNIPLDASWTQNGVTIAGGYGLGNGTNQLNHPFGFYIDDEERKIFIADQDNHRILAWKLGDNSGQVVAGNNGKGNQTNQLDLPTHVIFDKVTDSLIICDHGNRRIVRWSHREQTSMGEMIADIDCWGLTIDDQRFLYVTDSDTDVVRRYRMGDTVGTIVAGGNGGGPGLNQLNSPMFVFVDKNYSVYVSDLGNSRVVKWTKDAKTGIVVAGGQGRGDSLSQLSWPRGLFVDALGTIYVADEENHRIMRWPNGAQKGTVIAGGNSYGQRDNQLYWPEGLSLDLYGNLYVVDNNNHRIQRFSIKMN